eukprot:5688690-Amphidinium_carterae.1
MSVVQPGLEWPADFKRSAPGRPDKAWYYEQQKPHSYKLTKKPFLAADKAGSAEVLVLEPEEAEAGQEAKAGQGAPEAGGAKQPSLKRRKTHVERGVQVWFLEFCAAMSKRRYSKSQCWDMAVEQCPELLKDVDRSTFRRWKDVDAPEKRSGAGRPQKLSSAE